MRPLFLTVEGIKSISERQSINFDELAKSGIFGIFGKTGSGKSTILDCIVLAFFGEVIGKIDNAKFISCNRDQAMVELLFVAGAQGTECEYRVKRTFKFDKKRTKVKTDATLWKKVDDGEISIAEGTNNVNSKIKEDIIGLDKDDFLKCIALPQGAFSEFVKLTRSNRIKVMEQLFDLQKYGKQLFDKVSTKKSEAERKRAELQGELNGLDEDLIKNFDAIEKAYEKIGSDLDLIKKEHKENQEELDIAKRVDELSREKLKKTYELNEKLAYKAIIDAYTQEITAFDNVLKVQSLINSCEENSKKLQGKTLKSERVKQEKEEYKNLLLQATENKKELSTLEKNKSKLAEERGAIIGNKSLNDQAQAQCAETEEYRALYIKHDRDEKSYKLKMQENERLIARIDKDLQNTNLSVWLEKMSGVIQTEQLNKFVLDEISFLTELKKQLRSVVDNYAESAVNQLIEGHIVKIQAEITQKNEPIELKTFIKQLLDVLEENTNLNKEKARLVSNNENLKNDIERVTKEKNEVEQKGKKSRGKEDELRKKMQEVFKGLGYDGALKSVDEQIANIDQKIDTVNKEYEKALTLYNDCDKSLEKLQAEITQLSETLKKDTQTLNSTLSELSLDRESAKRILCKRFEIESKRKEVSEYEKCVYMLQGRLNEIDEKLNNVSKSYFNLQFFIEKCKASEEKLNETSKNYGEIKTRHDNGLKNKDRWCIIKNKLEELDYNINLYGKLYELTKSEHFAEFIAEEYLTEIADRASERVLELTNGRYVLQYKSEDNFYVADNLRGGELRPVASLSGGETFLVSLSLALALSFQISSRAMRPIDFFFLDEGFGTLDDELINAVTDSLEKLQKSRLTVGLITHVAELKNRIQAKLYVNGATATSGTTFTESY